MVQQDHVIAFLNYNDVLSTPTVAPYLESVGVPAIGGTLAETSWFTNPDFFPQGVEAQIGNYIGVKVGVERGLTKVGVIYCVEFALICSTDAALTVQNAFSVRWPSRVQRAGLARPT